MFLTYVYSSHGANGGKANGSDPWPPAGSAVSSQLTLSSFLLGGGEWKLIKSVFDRFPFAVIKYSDKQLKGKGI